MNNIPLVMDVTTTPNES